MTPERAARRLTDLLAAEREAAAVGDLARLAALAPEKARLAEAVEAGLAEEAFGSGNGSAAALGGLAAALREGEPLLLAALEGVRAARESVEARRAARAAPLRTYGRDGAASALDRGPAGPVRRA